MNSSELKKEYSGPIAWMTKNHVAANLLMFIILIGGFFSALKMKQEVFPEFDIALVTVSCIYPGSSPDEVEQGILLVIEEAVRGIDGIDEITATATEGTGSVNIKLLNDANSNKVLNDVKNKIDRITNFPEDMETPSVSLATSKLSVITVIISGEEDHGTLHGIAEKVRSDLLASPDISQVELSGIKPLEISVEISRENLESYGLTLSQVARQIKAFSVELPGGSVETSGGAFMIRVADRRLYGDQFENISIKGSVSGKEVLLGDIAEIKDGYADVDLQYRFNGEPAVAVTAYRVGKETPTKVAESVKKYLENEGADYPESIKMTTWDDTSILLDGRIRLLLKNALSGLVLVIIVLSLFLQKRLAMWVALGIPVSFMGTFLLMPGFDASINMITLFALIITLGMVVDDAIVIAENVYHKMNKGLPPLQAAIEGAQEMAMPVTFSILTTIAAFTPLLMMPGVMGKVFYLIPVVVIMVLIFSWLESFVILPAHLAHGGKEGKIAKMFHWVDILQEGTNRKLASFIENRYEPTVRKVIEHRYIALSFAFALLIVVLGMRPAGILKFNFMPKIDTDVVGATLRLPYGTPLEQTEEVAATLLEGAQGALSELDTEPTSRGVRVQLVEAIAGDGPIRTNDPSSNL